MGCCDFSEVEILIYINYLFQILGLGSLISEPHQVTGGLLHKMYRVSSTQGHFAVKILNPEIMKRSEALKNTILSERIASALIEDVPLVAAMEFAGEQVHELQGKYYMVFPWLEGASVFAPKITERHCAAIGDLLGKIHTANVCVEGVAPEEEAMSMYAWEEYLRQAEVKGVQQTAWFTAYRDALEDVIQLNKSACEAQMLLVNKQVISHRDLDPKNVMWQGERPFVIDWEAAGYVNPYQELLEVINYWTDDGSGGLCKGHLEKLLAAYKKHMDLQDVNWEPVFAGSYSGMLGWLEYNVKRALGVEVSCEEDIRAGEEQVIGTIAELYAYKKKLAAVYGKFSSF